jgi:hypothetical protein
MCKIALFLVSLVLAGCTTVGTGVVTGIADVPPDKGVVVFSTGADQTNLSFSTALMLVDGESYKRYDKVIVNTDYPFSSHFAGEHGHVRSLSLKPGSYYLIPVSVNPFFVTTKAPIYKFAVAGGAVTYVGNVSLKNRVLTISESYQERDVKYFLDRNPKIGPEQVKKMMMKVDGYLTPGSPPPFTIKGVIWEAPQ